VLPVTLARLTGEFLDFVNRLADTDPSDAQAVAELEALLDHSATAIQDKTVAIAAVIREFEARAEGAHTEAQRIATHARAASSRAVWLRDYLLKNLELLGVQRIDTATTYLIFNEGYAASSGERLIREELTKEAIRLGRLLVELMPDEPEAVGLLALMLLELVRSDARSTAAGSWCPCPSRTVAAGTAAWSRRDRSLSADASGATSQGPTRSKPRSMPFTATRPPRRKPTGPKSSRSTTSSALSPPRRSSP